MDYAHPDAKKHRILPLPLEPYGRRDAMDFEHQIHCLETEAYCSILKAFICQSDLLTWGKVGLITELRKELNVTDVEHGEILMKIHSDESVKWMREQRKLSSYAQDYVIINMPAGPSASVGNSIVRLKTPSSAAFYPQKNMSRSHVSLTSIQMPPPMPPKFNDDRSTMELSHGNVEQSREMLNYNVQIPPIGRGRPLKGKHQLKKAFQTSECVKLKNRSDLIEIRATDGVIRDVENILFNRERPDPVEIERAKRTLKEQERAILEALGKLADVLDRDDPSNQMRPYEVTKDTSRGQQMMMRGNYCALMGRMNGLGDSFRYMPSG